MTFWLYGEVITLHLDNSTTKDYLYNHGDTVSTFLSRLACKILNLVNIHGINLIPAYLPTHVNVEASCHREGWFQYDTFYLYLIWRWICWHPHIPINVSIITP